MPYIQIGLIDPENLPPDQKAWVKSQPEEQYRNIAYITDGDESTIHEIHTATVQTPEELAEEIIHGEIGVRVTLINEEHNEDVLRIFDRLLKDGDEKKPGYWGGSLTYIFD